MDILEKLKPLGLLCLRLGLGVIFFFHGYQKLFAATPAALQAFPRMGFPTYFVYISGTVELFGAVLLFLGLFTRVAALLLAGEMAVVLSRVAILQGTIYAVRNYEFPLALFAATFALATVGAGLISLDATTFERGSGTMRAKSKK